MTVLHSNNFEAEANGALTGWATQGGVGLTVTTANSVQGVPVQGTKHFGTNSDGDASRWESGGALTDQAVRFAQRWSSSASIGALLRAQTTLADRGVLMLAQESGGNLRGNILVRDNGTVSQAQSLYNVPVAAGDLVHLEARVVGNVFELRIWTNSNARPSSATISLTSTTWTSGRAALRQISGGPNLACCDNLVITDAAGGEDLFYPPGDGTLPTLSGSITVGTVTSASIQMSWPAGSDNTAVAGYDVSSNGGTSYTPLGNVLTHTFTGLTPSTAYQLRVRARDAAGNLSTPVLSASQSTSAAPGASIVLAALRNNTGTLLANETGATVHVYTLAGALVVSKTGQTSNAGGVCTVNDAALTAATRYRYVIVLASGAEGMGKATAA
jgi:chitodextrinase